MKFNSKIIEQKSFYTWLTLVFLFGQWVLIALTSVNVPAGDEWENLNAGALPSGFSFEYLFAFHNEHRIVFTKLLTYAFFYLTHWNLSYHVIFNYTLFAAVVLFFMFFKKKFISQSSKGLWILPFFLTSPLLIDNHNWAIQSCFHFCVLFGVLGIFFATREHLRNIHFWLAGLLGLGSMYSLAAGAFFTLTVLFVLLYRLLVGPRKSLSEWALQTAAVAALIAGIGAWFIGFHSPSEQPVFTWPYKIDFWYFYANLISLGFGFKTSSAIIAALALGIVAFVLGKSFKAAFSFKQHFVSLGFFGSLAVLGAFGSIALARTGYGIGQAKTSRYAELGVLLVLYIGWLLWKMAQETPKYQRLFKYFIWFVFIGFLGDYSYPKYFSVAEERQEGLRCISKYYSGENKTGDCPVLYPGPLAERLERAKAMKLSWVPF
jgi:hypothetical protein